MACFRDQYQHLSILYLQGLTLNIPVLLKLDLLLISPGSLLCTNVFWGLQRKMGKTVSCFVTENSLAGNILHVHTDWNRPWLCLWWMGK